MIFDKVLRLRRLQQAAASFEDTFWSGGSLDDLYDRVGKRPVDPMSAVFAAAMREWRRSAAKGLLGTPGMRSSLQQRIERVMNVTVGREMDRVERFMSFLATVGSTAPFVGLFGTVWGIMNSFQAIAASKNTSLAVVAPGIAEALFATALGLVAAIPAVVAYNKLATDFGRYAGRLEGFADRVQRDPVAPARREAVSDGRPRSIAAAAAAADSGGGRYRPMAEINVTPMVDVMLVLLVVFMVTAPLLTVGVPVDLPQTAAPAINEPKEPLTITVNRDGAVFLQETGIEADSLVPRLQAITGGNPDAVLYVRGDKAINYGRVLEMMSLVSAAGFRKVSLVAEMPKAGPAPARHAGHAKR